MLLRWGVGYNVSKEANRKRITEDDKMIKEEQL